MDGFVVGHVPADVGAMVSDFQYEWEGVAFTSRVWEREVADGYRVDLQLLVLRGDRLADLPAVRDFLATYHERDPDRWELREFRHGDHPGLIGETEAFWLVEPGVAAEVRDPSRRYGAAELRATALGVRPVSGGNGGA